MKRTLYALAGASAAVVITTTSALAGSGIGGVFNLGQMNNVDAQSSLAGNPGGMPELKVVTQGPLRPCAAKPETGSESTGSPTPAPGSRA